MDTTINVGAFDPTPEQTKEEEDEDDDDVDYQRSPYIKLHTGELYFTETMSPIKSTSPNFNEKFSDHLYHVSLSAKAKKKRLQEVKRNSANIVKAPIKSALSHMNPE